MDTTLRDGEQTPGVSYTPAEKLQIARILLSDVGVDRIEIASTRISQGEAEGARNIIKWAKKEKLLDKVEILGFVDGKKSVDWIKKTGGTVMNLLAKGSEKHCRLQLGKEPAQHYQDILHVINYAVKNGIKTNLYLEDWSNGVQASFQYVHALVSKLINAPIDRFMLSDTLGILGPNEVKRYLDWMFSAFPGLKFDFHAHNDYGLANANTLVAAQAGVNGVHVTVNGLGERAGNASLAEVVATIHDMAMIKTNIRETRLDYVSKIVQAFSGKRLMANAPVVGSDVYTQTSGVHADGDKKGKLYTNALLPERFSRKRKYALGKLSGRSSIQQNLKAMGLELPRHVEDRVLEEVIRLGDKKKKVTPEDLHFIIADVLRTAKEKKIQIVNYEITTKHGVQPSAKVWVKIKDKVLVASGKGNGGYDAFMVALQKALKQSHLFIPKLADYEVHIPLGGKTDALVETTISWENGQSEPLATIGVDSDQLVAAIEATEKMLNIKLAEYV
jgi:D-citramalate synthase